MAGGGISAVFLKRHVFKFWLVGTAQSLHAQPVAAILLNQDGRIKALPNKGLLRPQDPPAQVCPTGQVQALFLHHIINIRWWVQG